MRSMVSKNVKFFVASHFIVSMKVRVTSLLLLLPLNVFLELCKNNVKEALTVLIEHGETSTRQLMQTLKLSKKGAWGAVKTLLNAELISVSGRGKFRINGSRFRNNNVILNLRDNMLSNVFKRRLMRPVILELIRNPQASVSQIVNALSVSHMSVRRVLADLQSAGISAGQLISHVYEPDDPLEHVPRSIHRDIMKHLLRFLEARGALHLCSAIVVYGAASTGSITDEVDTAVVSSLTMEAEKHVRLMETMLEAKENIEQVFSTGLNVVAVIEDALLSAKLGITSTLNYTLVDILNGICVWGRLPEPEDYFDLFMKAFPMSQRDIEEKIQKGYLAQISGRLVFTKKAIDHFRQHAPTNLIDIFIPIRDQKMRLITIGKLKPDEIS
ncbi:MAG: hypothetical protein QXD86_06435 [Candidatus Bathyarchaeia archaeon]